MGVSQKYLTSNKNSKRARLVLIINCSTNIQINYKHIYVIHDLFAYGNDGTKLWKMMMDVRERVKWTINLASNSMNDDHTQKWQLPLSNTKKVIPLKEKKKTKKVNKIWWYFL